MNPSQIELLLKIFKILTQSGLIALFIFIPFEQADAMYLLSIGAFFVGVTGQSFIKTPQISKIIALKRTIFVLVLGLILFFVLRPLTPIKEQAVKIYGQFSVFEAIFYFLKTPVLLVFSFFLVLEDFKMSGAQEKDLTQSKLLIALLTAFFILVTLSCFSSLAPNISFKQFWKEMGLYIWLTLAVWKEILSFKEIRKIIFICAIISIVVGIIGTADILLYKFGSETTKESLVKNEWIRVQDSARGYTHIQYPFRHHNRMASFCMMGTIICLMQILFTKPGLKRTFISLFSFFPFIALILTLCRGSIIAFIISYVFFISLRKPKRLFILPILLVVIFLLLPQKIKERYTSIFNPTTYTTQDGSFYFRVLAWKSAIKIITDHPILGVGYSYQVFEKIYGFYSQGDTERKSHSHNNFLEIAIETGIFNLFIFLIFLFNLFIGLAKRLKQKMRLEEVSNLAIGMLTFILGVVIFGLTNYSFRYSIGAFIFLWFGLILSFLKITEESLPKV